MDSHPRALSGWRACQRTITRPLRRLLVSTAAVLAVAALAAPAATRGVAGSISVTASLNGCSGLGGSTVCSINVSYGSLAGADYYTAKVTRPDGSTQAFGTVAPGHASLPVTYTGDGRYVVTISAWRG